MPASASPPPDPGHDRFEAAEAWPAGLEAIAKAALPEFLLRQRWYPAKDAGHPTITLTALIPFPVPDGVPAAIAVWGASPPGRAPLALFVPLAVVSAADASAPQMIAHVPTGDGEAADERRIVEAFSLDAFVRAWIEAGLRGSWDTAGAVGLRIGRTERLAQTRLDARGGWAIRRGSAEQSNTSIRVGETAILKVIRKLEEGVHPELEVGRFLTGEARFAATPDLLAWIELDGSGSAGPLTLSVLQSFVPNKGDGWAWLVQRLGRAMAFEGSGKTTLRDATEWLERLGRRTAEMHLAFCTETTDPAFQPEPVQAADVRAWIAAAEAMAGRALDGLDAAKSQLAREERDLAEALLARREEVLERLQAGLRDVPAFAKTRHHGDYHLGQVLVTSGDAVIVDFEGEPLRPLAERRAKHAVLRDAAGMLRSIAYAAATAGRALPAHQRVEAEPRLAAWEAAAALAYLEAYFAVARSAASCPADRAQAERVVRFFMLEKALYEIAYELANRPDWVGIPLRGVLALLDGEPR